MCSGKGRGEGAWKRNKTRFRDLFAPVTCSSGTPAYSSREQTTLSSAVQRTYCVGVYALVYMTLDEGGILKLGVVLVRCHDGPRATMRRFRPTKIRASQSSWVQRESRSLEYGTVFEDPCLLNALSVDVRDLQETRHSSFSFSYPLHRFLLAFVLSILQQTNAVHAPPSARATGHCCVGRRACFQNLAVRIFIGIAYRAGPESHAGVASKPRLRSSFAGRIVNNRLRRVNFWPVRRPRPCVLWRGLQNRKFLFLDILSFRKVSENFSRPFFFLEGRYFAALWQRRSS